MALFELTNISANEYQAEESYIQFHSFAKDWKTQVYPVLIRGLKTCKTRWVDVFEKNEVHDKGFLHWAGWFSMITTTGDKYVRTFWTKSNAKYSFIAASAVNKGKEGVSGEITDGGLGYSTVEITFKSSVQGAWHIFVVFATEDPDVKALT